MLSPGGYFAWTVESVGTQRLLGDALDPVLMGELRQVLSAMLTGRIVVRYVSEERGRSQLGITIDVKGTKDLDDLTALATQIVAELPGWGTIEIEQFDLTFALEAVGTAEWDTEEGNLTDLVLEGSLETAMDLELIWVLGKELAIDISTVASSAFVQSVEIRRSE